MRTLKFALRAVTAGLILSSGVAAAALNADLSLAVTFVPKSATEVDSTTLAYGGTREVKATLSVPLGQVATGITLDFTSFPVDTNYPAGNVPEVTDPPTPDPAIVVVTAVTNCTPTAAARAAEKRYPCTVTDLMDGATKDVVITLSQPMPGVKPTACNHTAVYTAPFTVVATTTSVDTTANTGSVLPVGVPLVFADLEVTFTGAETANEGDNVTYDVTVTNNGPCVSRDVWVVSDAYVSVPFVSATWACNNLPPDDSDLESDGCQLGDIAVGPTAAVTFTKTYNIPNMSSDATSLYHPNGVTLTRKVLDTAVTDPPLPARTTKVAPLATRDLDTDNNSDGLATVVTQSVSGCSTAGAGGPTGLLALGAVLALAFRRRRAA